MLHVHVHVHVACACCMYMLHVHVHVHVHVHAHAHATCNMVCTGVGIAQGHLEPRRRVGRQRWLAARRLDEDKVVWRRTAGAATLRALSAHLGRAELCNARGGQRRVHLGGWEV